MARVALPVQVLLDRLTQAPQRISAVTAPLSPAQLRTAPKSDEWSANDLLAHLRSCSDMWGGYIAPDRGRGRAGAAGHQSTHLDQ